jgi:hypothetical protein
VRSRRSIDREHEFDLDRWPWPSIGSLELAVVVTAGRVAGVVDLPASGHVRFRECARWNSR